MKEKPEPLRERCLLSSDGTFNIQRKFGFYGSDPGKQCSNLKYKCSFLKEFTGNCLKNTVGEGFSWHLETFSYYPSWRKVESSLMTLIILWEVDSRCCLEETKHISQEQTLAVILLFVYLDTQNNLSMQHMLWAVAISLELKILC